MEGVVEAEPVPVAVAMAVAVAVATHQCGRHGRNQAFRHNRRHGRHSRFGTMVGTTAQEAFRNPAFRHDGMATAMAMAHFCMAMAMANSHGDGHVRGHAHLAWP